MNKNVADLLVEMLVEAGVKRIYGVTGDSLNEFNYSVHKNGKIKWIHVRHEEAGAFAASAEADLEGIACCAGSCGPGHIHLINGLYDAHRNGAPVIAIASTIPTEYFGTDYYQGSNTIKLFDDCSWYNQVIQTPAQAPKMMQAGIQHAIHQRGVAVISLPGDISSLPAEDIPTSIQNFSGKSILRPIASELQEIADILNQHSRISVFCGFGAREAHDEIVKLASTLLSPVSYTYRAKMEIQYNNPYEVGMTGHLGQPSAYHSMHEAEVVLL